MGDYLRKRGLPDKRIVQEEISTSTHENLLFSQVILSDHGWQHHETIALVTSDFHTLRAGRIAARLGYQQVQLIGVPTPLYLRYNAWLREAFAFLSGVVLGEM